MAPMSETDAPDVLRLLQAALASGQLRFNRSDEHAQALWMSMHDLAEVSYRPALSFFGHALDSSDALLRWTTIRNLGYHYSRDDLKQFLPRFRELLLEETDEDTRRTIAEVLGRVSEWPDVALLKTLKSDPDPDVREQAFHSLSRILNLSEKDFERVRHQLGVAGELSRNYATLEGIATAVGKTLPDD